MGNTCNYSLEQLLTTTIHTCFQHDEASLGEEAPCKRSEPQGIGRLFHQGDGLNTHTHTHGLEHVEALLGTLISNRECLVHASVCVRFSLINWIWIPSVFCSSSHGAFCMTSPVCVVAVSQMSSTRIFCVSREHCSLRHSSRCSVTETYWQRRCVAIDVGKIVERCIMQT